MRNFRRGNGMWIALFMVAAFVLAYISIHRSLTNANAVPAKGGVSAAANTPDAAQQRVVWDDRETDSPAHYINMGNADGGYQTACGGIISGWPARVDTIEAAVAKGHKPCPDCIMAMTTYTAPAYWKAHEPRRK